MRDEVDFVLWGVDIRESVGRFVTDGRETDGAKMENMVKESFLVKGNIFDFWEVDDIGRFCEERLDRKMKNALVCNEHLIPEINFRHENAGKKHDGVKREEEGPEIFHGARININVLRDVTKNKGKSDAENQHGQKFANPKQNKAKLRTRD